jgi:hypothetical protein
MPNVLVAGGTIQCSHGGSVKVLQGDDRLEIANAAVIVAGMESGLSFAPGSPGVQTPCPWPSAVQPPVAGSSPCTATMAAGAGVSQQLTVGGKGALLDNANGLATNSNVPAATWSVAMAGQTLVSVDH